MNVVEPTKVVFVVGRNVRANVGCPHQSPHQSPPPHPHLRPLSPVLLDNVPGLHHLRRCLVVIHAAGLTVPASKNPAVGLKALACAVTKPAPASMILTPFKHLQHAVKMRVAVGKAVPAGR